MYKERKQYQFGRDIKNNCQAANLFHTFSATTQGITLHLKLLSLYLPQKCRVNLNAHTQV